MRRIVRTCVVLMAVVAATWLLLATTSDTKTNHPYPSDCSTRLVGVL